jgi:hypothetical protein
MSQDGLIGLGETLVRHGGFRRAAYTLLAGYPAAPTASLFLRSPSCG